MNNKQSWSKKTLYYWEKHSFNNYLAAIIIIINRISLMLKWKQSKIKRIVRTQQALLTKEWFQPIENLHNKRNKARVMIWCLRKRWVTIWIQRKIKKLIFNCLRMIDAIDLFNHLLKIV